MSATSIPTIPLYLRIPVALRERLDAAARGHRSYVAKGDLADTAIKAMSRGLDELHPLHLVPVEPEPVKRTHVTTARGKRTKRGATIVRKPARARR